MSYQPKHASRYSRRQDRERRRQAEKDLAWNMFAYNGVPIPDEAPEADGPEDEQ